MRALQWGSSLVHHQLRLLASLVLWVRGRQHGFSPGAAAMRYDHAVGPMLLLVLGLSVVEIVVVGLVLPWPVPRLVLLLLGAYASLFIVGTIAANRVRPHILSGWLFAAALRCVGRRPRSPAESGESRRRAP